MNDNRKIPKLPSVKRLPSYLHELKLLRDQQQQMVSTTHLAQKLGLEPIIVRKDLELASSPGSPGVGYSVQSLISGIENFLGWNDETPVFLVGVGNLGTALLGYRGFAEYRFNIVAAFDIKKDGYKELIIKETYFGESNSCASVIEFEKNGFKKHIKC